MSVLIAEPLRRENARENIEAAALAGYCHYVYGLVVPETKEVFYVGKGSGFRMFVHGTMSDKSRNYGKRWVIKEFGCLYTIFAFFSDKHSAFAFEKEKIAEIGRHVLFNLSEGGEGLDPVLASEFALKQWSDPDSLIRKVVQSEQYRQTASVSSRRMWENKYFRERHSAAMNKPYLVEFMRDLTKSRMRDPEERYKAGNGKRGVKQDAEIVEKRKAGARKYWSNPENRKKQSERISAACSTLEGRNTKFVAALVSKQKRGLVPKSGYQGVEQVVLADGSKVFSATIKLDGKRKRFGRFKKGKDAYRMFYDKCAEFGYDVSCLIHPDKVE